MKDSIENNTIVLDYETIYEIRVNSIPADLDEVLSKYKAISDAEEENDLGETYLYTVLTYSEKVFVIEREVESSTLGFIPPLVQLSANMADWWAKAYPIIEKAVTIFGAGEMVLKIVKFAREKLRAKTEDELTGIKAIINRDTWNASELASEYGMELGEAKNLLTGFGFTWDKSSKLYTKSELTEKLKFIKAKEIVS